MNLFQKAARNFVLTPAERAVLKLIKSLGYVAIINVLYALTQYLALNGEIDTNALIHNVLWQIMLAVVLALGKYFTAQGDIATGMAISALEAQVAKRAPSTIDPQMTDYVAVQPAQTVAPAYVQQPAQPPSSIVDETTQPRPVVAPQQ